jgi:CubicO group peptidase (beta-lactamase class C family)
MTRFSAFLFVLVFLFASDSQAQSTDLEARVDSVLAAWDGADRPGIAVAYFEGGERVFAKAYGLASLEHGIAWRTDTVSDLGSVSKQFTGFALALLAEEGALLLDDDIRTHLPDLPDLGATITIDDLIYHRSGLREIYNTLAMVNWRDGDGIFQEHAQLLVQHQDELQFAPGSRYLYNNTEYMLMADIIESVTGMEFHDWMEERIFAPLGMDDTTIMVRQGQVIPGAATSYVRDRAGHWNQIYDNSTVQGAGGIYSTVEDVGKWMRNFATHEVGTAATIDALTTQGMLTNGEPIDYGRGIIVTEVGGQTVWVHNGASAGYRAQMFYVPEYDRGYVMVTGTPSFRNPHGGLTEAFFSDILVEEESNSGSRSQEEEGAIQLPELADPAAFTGTWLSDELQVFYDIKLEDGNLTLAHRWLGSFDMTWAGNDRFTLGGVREVRFERETEGRPISFVWDNGRTIGVTFRRYE